MIGGQDGEDVSRMKRAHQTCVQDANSLPDEQAFGLQEKIVTEEQGA